MTKFEPSDREIQLSDDSKPLGLNQRKRGSFKGNLSEKEV
ncbi:hypothetical protein COLO4_28704 [Corchorus olitorius]|uniref:Uncharacterized protein n=1 Tax=Corchorus olitorius TaxID=93759 RepID=A0A1R3HIS0_9ROSI|nr:hypothetical protein COLO4_28704 [Corchorus olitorius]